MSEPASTRKRYTGEAVDVSFDPVRCRHAAECLRTHPRASAAHERAATPTEVIAMPGGPVLLRGDLHVTAPSGLDEHETRAALCACGATANAPYCDGSGTCRDWPHPRGGARPHLSWRWDGGAVSIRGGGSSG